jgi:methyl-accepting chemotaxis protein
VSSTSLPRSAASLTDIALIGDKVMFFTLFAQAAASIAIGQYHGNLGLALGCSAVLLALGSALFAGARGTLASQIVLTLSNAAFVALHIQLGAGTIEFHFGVFVLLGLLLVYRDWRALVVAAGFFAVHHVAFDRLQALGFGVYCTPEANLLKTLMHAIYVVVQTGIEIYLAIGLHRAAVEGAELSRLIAHVDRGDRLCLDVHEVPVSAPTATLLKAALVKMESAMGDVATAAATIETATSEIASGNLDLSERTEEQASSLLQTAASMERLTQTVRDTAETAGQADRLASSSSTAASDGGEAVGKVVSTMAEISESSRRIADIISVIDGIAFQTNILALNAAVEAARAGEQGRGFAVVAGEVRALAQRSAAAAREIKSLIVDSVDKVESGSKLVGVAGETMDSIVGQVRRVSELIGEISTAAQQQSGGIGEVGQAVSQLDRVTQQNTALVEESAAAAESLKHQAVRLNAVLSRFLIGARCATA